MTTLATLAQIRSWHEGGLFIGMHWIWWLAWALTLLALVWAFARASRDRGETRRRRTADEAAEDVVRRRFAEGEIDEEELARSLRVLRETHRTG